MFWLGAVPCGVGVVPLSIVVVLLGAVLAEFRSVQRRSCPVACCVGNVSFRQASVLSSSVL
jgi:hypothetical protein